MVKAAQVLKSDAENVWLTGRNTEGANTIVEMAQATDLKPRYVRELLVKMDKMGLIAFHPDMDEQVTNFHWDMTDAEVWEMLWKDGEDTTTPATAAPTECLCGCGQKVSNRKRQYLPGHDARHASHVAKRIIAGGDFDTNIATLPTAKLQLKATAQVKRAAERALGKTEAWVEGEAKVGRWVYPARRKPNGSTAQVNTQRDGQGSWKPLELAKFQPKGTN